MPDPHGPQPAPSNVLPPLEEPKLLAPITVPQVTTLPEGLSSTLSALKKKQVHFNADEISYNANALKITQTIYDQDLYERPRKEFYTVFMQVLALSVNSSVGLRDIDVVEYLLAEEAQSYALDFILLTIKRRQHKSELNAGLSPDEIELLFHAREALDEQCGKASPEKKALYDSELCFYRKLLAAPLSGAEVVHFLYEHAPHHWIIEGLALYFATTYGELNRVMNITRQAEHFHGNHFANLALMHAAKKGHLECVKVLLEAGIVLSPIELDGVQTSYNRLLRKNKWPEKEILALLSQALAKAVHEEQVALSEEPSTPNKEPTKVSSMEEITADEILNPPLDQTKLQTRRARLLNQKSASDSVLSTLADRTARLSTPHTLPKKPWTPLRNTLKLSANLPPIEGKGLKPISVTPEEPPVVQELPRRTSKPKDPLQFDEEPRFNGREYEAVLRRQQTPQGLHYTAKAGGPLCGRIRPLGKESLVYPFRPAITPEEAAMEPAQRTLSAKRGGELYQDDKHTNVSPILVMRSLRPSSSTSSSLSSDRRVEAQRLMEREARWNATPAGKLLPVLKK